MSACLIFFGNSVSLCYTGWLLPQSLSYWDFKNEPQCPAILTIWGYNSVSLDNFPYRITIPTIHLQNFFPPFPAEAISPSNATSLSSPRPWQPFFLILILLFCVCIYWLHVCLCTIGIQHMRKPQEGVGIIEPELQIV